jgi:hypothetical protein
LPEHSAAGPAPTATCRSAMTRPHRRRAAPTAPSACPPRWPRSPWRVSRPTSLTGTPTRPSGPTAKPGSPPGSSRPRSMAWSTPARWWCSTQHGTAWRYRPWPAGCSRWGSPPPSPRTWHRAGPTAWPERWSRPGRPSVLWARTNSWPGSSAPPGRQTTDCQPSTSALARPAVLRRVLSRPQPLTTSAWQGASATRQTWRDGPRVRPPDSRPSPPAGSVARRRLQPGPSMTRRWPRTGSACRPAARCRNADSHRCSGAPPAAGLERESLMHDSHRRSQTHRAPQSLPTSADLGVPPGRLYWAALRVQW